MRTWLLLHGASHGGWCWADVRALLEADGDRVLTPTLSGLGERAGELTADLDLQTWIDEIAALVRAEALTDTILVGHSFGGPIISAVAEQVPERIARLVYLDALLLEDGESPFDTLRPDVVATRREQAEATSGGLTFPAPHPRAFGVLDPALADAIAPKLTPHPLATYESKLRLANAPAAGFQADYVISVDPIYVPLADARERAKSYGWPLHEIATGHDMMVTAPEATVALLRKIAAS